SYMRFLPGLLRQVNACRVIASPRIVARLSSAGLGRLRPHHLALEACVVPQDTAEQSAEGRHADEQEQRLRRPALGPLETAPHKGDGSRRDWLSRQPAAQIVGQALRLWIALAGILLQALERDSLQFARHLRL